MVRQAHHAENPLILSLSEAKLTAELSTIKGDYRS
jgi:hypothetical protein